MNILQIPSVTDTTALDSLEHFSARIAQKTDSLANMDTEQFIATISKDASKLFTPETLDYIIHGLISFGLKLLAALAIYIIGAWIIRKCKRLVMRIFERRKTEKSLASFVINLISITLTVILIVIAISTLGINTTSIPALLAS